MYAVQGPVHYVLPYVFTIYKAECKNVKKD